MQKLTGRVILQVRLSSPYRAPTQPLSSPYITAVILQVRLICAGKCRPVPYMQLLTPPRKHTPTRTHTRTHTHTRARTHTCARTHTHPHTHPHPHTRAVSCCSGRSASTRPSSRCAFGPPGNAAATPVLAHIQAHQPPPGRPQGIPDSLCTFDTLDALGVGGSGCEAMSHTVFSPSSCATADPHAQLIQQCPPSLTHASPWAAPSPPLPPCTADGEGGGGAVGAAVHVPAGDVRAVPGRPPHAAVAAAGSGEPNLPRRGGRGC